MNAAGTVLHLVRGEELPAELHAAAAGDTVVFFGPLLREPWPRCRLLTLGPGSDLVGGIRHEDLLDLIFECDSVVTW